MAWRAAAQAIKLPDDLAEIEIQEDEEDESEHAEHVKNVITMLFEVGHLRPGVYNVTIAGHTNRTEDDGADNLSISINRTTSDMP